MEFLLHIDKLVFDFINQSLANSFFDHVLVFFRNPSSWIPLYIILAFFFILRFKKNGIIITIFWLVGTGIADYTSSSIVKPAVERLRPCRDIDKNPEVIARVKCGPGYSFPSSHATNHFAMGVFFYLFFLRIFRKYAFLFLVWAAIISFAQIYVGVHYPIDILGGTILGSLIGFGAYKLCDLALRRLFKTQRL
jgi:undecaprenyl-diphosphatase